MMFEKLRHQMGGGVLVKIAGQVAELDPPAPLCRCVLERSRMISLDRGRPSPRAGKLIGCGGTRREQKERRDACTLADKIEHAVIVCVERLPHAGLSTMIDELAICLGIIGP
ncbi:MAG TPA: hypothetical protein VKY22_20025 [Bradyrhizobium sp.]|nr:hypothetical protein [Bradyrhizobium sp.]